MYGTSGTGEPQGTPSSKAELMTRIHDEWAALEQLVRGLTPTQMTTPGPETWSVKDHLAHLAAWQRILVMEHLQGHSFAEAAGMDLATAAAMKGMTAETGLNDYFYRRDKDMPLDDALAAYAAAHQQVLAALEPLPEADLFKPLYPTTSDRLLLDYIISDTYWHYWEHRVIIAAIVGRADAAGTA
jgi:hypothetical protein